LIKASTFNQEQVISDLLELFSQKFKNNGDLLKSWVNKGNKQGFTALHYASFRGNFKSIEYLIQAGADIYSRNNEGLDVMHMAAQANQLGSLIYFKEKYHYDMMTKDNSGSTILHWSVFVGAETCANYLLNCCDYEVDCTDKEGITPLHLSVLTSQFSFY
jgi:ankyrin repeat protein